MKDGQYWLFAWVIMVTIFGMSDIPGLSLYDSRSLSPAWLWWIKKHTIGFGTDGFFSYMISPHPDFVLHKLGHIFAFGFLGMALYMATGRSMRWGVFMAAIFAVSDELHQYFVAGRSSRFWDIALDISAAVGFIYLLGIFQGRRRSGVPANLRGRQRKLKE